MYFDLKEETNSWNDISIDNQKQGKYKYNNNKNHTDKLVYWVANRTVLSLRFLEETQDTEYPSISERANTPRTYQEIMKSIIISHHYPHCAPTDKMEPTLLNGFQLKEGWCIEEGFEKQRLLLQ